MTPPGAVILRPIEGGRGAPIEALSATLTPRFTANQVVVQLAVGRELFEDDGTTLASCFTGDKLAVAVEEAMRELKAGGAYP